MCDGEPLVHLGDRSSPARNFHRAAEPSSGEGSVRLEAAFCCGKNLPKVNHCRPSRNSHRHIFSALPSVERKFIGQRSPFWKTHSDEVRGSRTDRHESDKRGEVQEGILCASDWPHRPQKPIVPSDFHFLRLSFEDFRGAEIRSRQGRSVPSITERPPTSPKFPDTFRCQPQSRLGILRADRAGAEESISARAKSVQVNMRGVHLQISYHIICPIFTAAPTPIEDPGPPPARS